MPATLAVSRPAPDEYIEYYGKYIGLVPGGDALQALRDQIGETVRLLEPLSESKALHRYAAGKWSVKEVVGHMADCERIFAYRALRFARGDSTPLAGFEENEYVPEGRFDGRPLAELVDDLERVRAASVALYRGLDEEALARRGTANDAQVSVRAIAWILVGHELHHRRILIEKYRITNA